MSFSPRYLLLTSQYFSTVAFVCSFVLMHKDRFRSRLTLWEVVFQLVLLAVVFIFYSYNRKNPQIEEWQVVFFLNYAIAACFINYWLLPRFLYRKKYGQFSLYTLLVIGMIIFIEEGILEQIYFPDTRGLRFPGVFFNLVGTMPTIAILAGFKFAWDALTKQRQVEQLQSTVKESELQFLKSQINPHFLFNNLNNLYAYALEQSPKTPEIILELSGVLRYMLYECQEEYVSLNKEIAQLKNFVNLSRMQFEDRGEIRFSGSEIEGNYRVAPLILPVFIENACKHSLSSQSDNIRIHIELSMKQEGQLHFKCENSFSPQSNTTSLSRGIGLENVRKRLSLLYPNSHKLEIHVDEDMYRVSLLLDLHQNER